MPEDVIPGEARVPAPGDGDQQSPEPAVPGTPLPDLPDDPEEALAMALDALDEVRGALAARTDDLQRVAADYENFRKRALRDREQMVLLSSQRLIQSLLPVLDSFAGALVHEGRTPAEEAMLAGMESTGQQLMEVLAGEGLEVIPTVGEPFDPSVHEAVMGGGDGDLVVTSEMRRGYVLNGRLLRPAMVGVSDAVPEEG